MNYVECPIHPEKRRFTSETRALEAMTGSLQYLGEIRVYKCKACHGYHLTAKPHRFGDESARFILGGR